MIPRSAEAAIVGAGACAVGFRGHGFQHSPATGRHVAAWLLDGQPELDLAPLGFARFAGRDLTVRGSLLSGVD
jgi:glycine/D-amino acid oxidase-like deaminating enzyme